jgi:EmrB/QacA subfamily drug resistance transporter
MPPAVSPNKWLVLVLVCFAQFMVVLDATIVNVALPSIQKDLELSEADLQWVVNSYTLMFGGFLLLGGRAADLLGRKRLFLAGIALFTFASLLDGLAQSGTMLILARGLQGLGAALVSPAALSIITTTFPEGEERTKALGVWGGIAAGGAAFGLLLGGILTDLLAWEWIFFVNVPIGIATFVFSSRIVPESTSGAATRAFDLAGAVTVTGGLVALVYGIVKAQEWGWGSVETLGIGLLAVALLSAFVVIERRSAAPLVRLDIFRTRTLTAANVVMLLVGSGLFAMFFFNSLYVQDILGYSPLKAGFAFLPISLCIVVGAGLSQQLVRMLGVRIVAIAGLTIAAVGMVLLTQISADGSYTSDLLPGLLPVGIGMGLTFVPITLIATAGLQDADQGLASGLFNTSQQVGGALGLAILSTLAVNTTSNALDDGAERAGALVDGWQAAFTGSAIFMVAGLVLLLVLLRPRDVAQVDTEQPVAVAA